jgi:glucose/arabinose dehydrogenase
LYKNIRCSFASSFSCSQYVFLYYGQQFPTKYYHGAFAAFHGSWNRYNGTGYKIVFIPFDDDHRRKGYYEDFIDGFLTILHRYQMFNVRHSNTIKE